MFLLRLATRNALTDLGAGTLVGPVVVAEPMAFALVRVLEVFEVLISVEFGHAGFGRAGGFSFTGHKGERRQEEGGPFHRCFPLRFNSLDARQGPSAA